MFMSEISNSSVEIKDILHRMNDTNVSAVISANSTWGLVPTNSSSFRETLLMCMALVSAVGQLVALIFNSYHIDVKYVSHVCVLHILCVGTLIGYAPMLSQLSFETGLYPMYFWGIFSYDTIKDMRNYVLTLSSYALVVLVLNCYNVVVKPLFAYPVHVCKMFMYIFMFYAIGTIPALLIHFARNYLDCGGVTVAPYFFPLPYQQFTGQYSMALILLLIYIIPLVVVLVLVPQILYTLKTKYRRNKKPVSSKCDCKLVKITFWMSLVYFIANIPFVVQAIVITYIDSGLIDPDVALLVEILSISHICFNPYIYLFIEENDFFCGPIYCLFEGVSWLFKYRSNNNEKVLLCCLNSTFKDLKASKPVDKAYKTEAIPMLFKA